jgi:hypothetical protein
VLSGFWAKEEKHKTRKREKTNDLINKTILQLIVQEKNTKIRLVSSDGGGSG